MTNRTIYALVVDCDEPVESVGDTLGKLAEMLRERQITNVGAINLHVEVPLAGDERRQSRERTSPVITLEEM